MVFYHDVLLAKVGCMEHWPFSVRTRKTISDAYHEKTRGQKRRLRIPSDLEAFVCTQFESSHKRWGLIAKKKIELGAKWTPSPKDETYWSTFTCPEQGMAGYTIEGRKHFGDMKKKITAARKQPHVAAIKERILHLSG